MTDGERHATRGVKALNGIKDQLSDEGSSSNSNDMPQIITIDESDEESVPVVDRTTNIKEDKSFKGPSIAS